MFTLNCRGKLLLIDKPVVMGIINVTPDSFFAGSRQENLQALLTGAEKMIRDGALFLDIGGQSTRPGSEVLHAEQEMERILPVMDALQANFPETLLSVDTYHSTVAREAIFHGATLINDISGGRFDENMLSFAASQGVPYSCMHTKGSRENMHLPQTYTNLTAELVDYFIERIDACAKAGIQDIVIDPGFGFSKNAAQNFELMRQLETFTLLGKPLLVGISRKSTIYQTLGITAEEALNGTTVLHTACLLKGANILRVHDVKEAMEAIELTSYLK
ncbi:MAG: dihydropteroate synthase [Bacteroidota bacterium]